MFLDPRSAEVFRCIVEAYMETGEPIGSRTLSKRLGLSLSPATIRNVMSDLENTGLLVSPHTSAGRLPTEAGLRIFVDGLMEFGDLPPAEQDQLEERCRAQGKSLEHLFEEATLALSGLSRCAGLVLAPKTEAPLKHLEFVYLNKGRAMVVMVTEDGMVENRILEISPDLSPSHLTEASNYLNRWVVGKRLGEARIFVEQDMKQQRTQLDHLAAQVIEEGFALWGGESSRRSLIIKGQAHLLEEIKAVEDLKQLQSLFEALETQEELLSLLDMTIEADGVQIFIGSGTPLFQLSGSAMIIAPYGKQNGRVVGAIGVIGPKRMNYGRIIPMVDYTAKLLGRLMS
jgi:heat-inducible transcriptional repressor